MLRTLSSLVALAGLLQSAVSAPTTANTTNAVKVRWIGDVPEYVPGATFGVPWPQGKLDPDEASFTLSAGGDGDSIPLQTWVTGYWRDGSIKWTGHALPQLDSVADEYIVTASGGRCPSKDKRRKRAQEGSLSVTDGDDEVVVDTGKITVTFPKKGNSVISAIETASGKTVGRNGKLVLHSQSALADDVASIPDTSIDYLNFESSIEKVTVTDEDEASVRALVTVRGKFEAKKGSHDDWLPFVLRFYLYSDSEAIRVVHSIIYDGDAGKDFISGLGIQFQVPLEGEELYNRHIRIGGVDGGFLHEAAQGITGLRRDPGAAVRTAQFEGRETPDIGTWDTRVSSRMHWVPVWNDFKLRQLTADGFSLKKRTKPGQSWIDISPGTRSSGLAYLGGATVGGLAVGLRDFWKQHPTGLDVSNTGADEGQLTLWLWSPESEPLDLRPYHDGLGQDTFKKQLDALEITYEDYQPGFDTPYGIAKTHELFIYAFDATPSAEHLSSLNAHLTAPPALYAEASHVEATKALGSYWSVPDTSDAVTATIEKNLDFLNKFYQRQVEDRRWFGFLHYGDFMHSYDTDRHTWKYDIGGYAWDNSELSPDLYFWQYFLRTGDAAVYRFAEALTRHTGEVDSYHIGDWKGLGTRHGILHFADSAKQARIAQPQYRKYFYYLSGGDERVGEVLEDTLDADKTYGILDALRKVRTDGWTPSPGEPVSISLGTDWAALAAGWLIEWERRGSRWEESRDKLNRTAASIANLKNGFVTGTGLYDIEAGTLDPPPRDPNNEGLIDISHLSAVFGAPEAISELIEYWGDDAPEGFADAWLDYCYYYGASAAEQTERYGRSFTGVSLRQGHARLTAYYYSQRTNETAAAARSWREFYNTDGFKANDPWVAEDLSGPEVLVATEEAAWVSTNSVAQYGLAAIQGLALAADGLDGYGS